MKCCAESRELMPWHLSKSDPRKVYDSYHSMVCVCQNAEQAKLIVDAVTAHAPQAETIRLREPAPLRVAPLDTFEPDDSCCGREIAKAARSGVLASLQLWTCPKCGLDWAPQLMGGIRHWTPRPAVAVFR